MDCSVNIDNFWESRKEEYSLEGDLQENYSYFLWNEANQDEGNLTYLLGEQTPIKDCTELGYHLPSTGEHANKASEECTESSQLKRRRMLQYDTSAIDCSISKKQFPVMVQAKVGQGSVMDDILPWGMQSGNYSIGHELLDKQSQEWLNKSGEGRSSFQCNEMIISEDEIDISDYYNIPLETKADEAPKATQPLPRINFKGRRCIETPKRLVTSVVYPFAVIKPSHIQGDSTLSEINKRIHTPPKLKYKNGEDPKLCYPTSAFSGKPVVSKTKIRTEGGKGSITITRTKG